MIFFLGCSTEPQGVCLQTSSKNDDKEKLKLKLTPLKVWLVNASPGLISAKSQ